MRLGEKQELFYRMNHKFDDWVLRQAGVEIRGGELWRPPAQALLNSETCRRCEFSVWDHTLNFGHKFTPVGIKNSNHCRKLAIDKNVFVHGVWITDSTDLTDLGEKWESMSRDSLVCCWGGRFRNPDGNHFSFLHGRVR